MHSAPPSWTTPATLGVNPTPDMANVCTCYDSLHNRMFAAWVDFDSSNPVYSIYSNGSWSERAFIDTTSMINNDVFLCYHKTEDKIFAAWRDLNNNDYPTYSVFSNGSWSQSAVIGTNLDVVGIDVYLCFDPSQNQILATWVGGSASAPAYSIYSSGTWSTPAYLEGVTPATAVVSCVYTCYDTAQNRFIAAWGDINNNTWPTYSIYSGGVWSAPSVMSTTDFTDDISLSYNSSENKVFATWLTRDPILFQYFATYSIFSGGAWSPSSTLDADPVSNCNCSLFNCYNTAHNQVFAAWTDFDANPIYSIYSNGAWDAPKFLHANSPTVLDDVFLAYNSQDDQVFATWGDGDTRTPYYSIYAQAVPLPNNPGRFRGKQLINQFGVTKEYYNQLSWKASTSTEIVEYLLYRDGVLIATLDADVLQYQDHNRPQSQSFTYTLKAVNSSGQQSTGVTILVKGSS